MYHVRGTTNHREVNVTSLGEYQGDLAKNNLGRRNENILCESADFLAFLRPQEITLTHFIP